MKQRLANHYYFLTIFDSNFKESLLDVMVKGKRNIVKSQGIYKVTFQSHYSVSDIENVLFEKKYNFILIDLFGIDINNFSTYFRDAGSQNKLFSDFISLIVDTQNNIVDIDFTEADPNIVNFDDLTANYTKFKKHIGGDDKKSVVDEDLSLNDILDKISETGFENLSTYEKGLLNEFSKK